MRAIERLGVAVPARNEQDLLPGCLAGLVQAAQQCQVPVDVVVVLDSCTDDTAAAVEAVEASYADAGVELSAISVALGSVGAARGAGMTHLLRRHPTPGTWLATTDADSVVPPAWFIRQLAYAASGADAVIRTISVADWGKHPAAVPDTATRMYSQTPAARHGLIGGGFNRSPQPVST